ncbi:MAG: hypothetical protein V1911_00985 [Candidatus Micrarchaeota archaeon]
MHKAMTTEISGRKIHMLRLIATFVIIGASLMLLSSVFKVFLISNILSEVNQGIPHQMQIDLDGVVITQNIAANDYETQTGMYMAPVAGIMFWSAILLAGGILYKLSFIRPVSERGRFHKK